MYLFNVGVTDAKGLHHPTVFALQLGKGYLRNKVVGAVWHNAHEWVRHNLSAVTTTLLDGPQKFDVKLELSVPEICYEASKGVVTQGCNWKGDAHGRAPLFRPVITFLPSRHRSKVDRFINRRGIIGLVGFADPHSLIRVPLDRFWVGLMAEIPARENFKNTKTSKTS